MTNSQGHSLNAFMATILLASLTLDIFAATPTAPPNPAELANLFKIGVHLKEKSDRIVRVDQLDLDNNPVKVLYREGDGKETPIILSNEAGYLQLLNRNTTLLIHSEKKNIAVLSQHVPNCRAKVKSGETAAVGFHTSGMMDIMTAEISKPVIVAFPEDGGGAIVYADSHARFEILDDHSYYFSVNGLVMKLDDEGNPSENLESSMPALTGGPLRDDKKGRLSPEIVVEFYGSLNANFPRPEDPDGQPYDLQLSLHGLNSETMESKDVYLIDFEPKIVVMANGSEIEFLLNQETETISWEILKGYFSFKHGDTPCWRAVSITDQKAELQWGSNGEERIDLRNQTEYSVFKANQIIWVETHPGLLFAGVEPNTWLQTEYPGPEVGFCDLVRTYAVGNNVHFFNRKTGRKHTITDAGVAFEGGVSLNQGDSDTPVRPKAKAKVDYIDYNIHIIVDDYQRITIKPGTDKEIDGYELLSESGPSLLAFRSLANDLTLTAENGDFDIKFSDLDNTRVELPMDQSITVNFNSNRKHLSIRGNNSNNDVVKFNFRGRSFNLKEQGHEVSIFMSRNKLFLSGFGDNLIIDNTPVAGKEGAGAGVTANFINFATTAPPLSARGQGLLGGGSPITTIDTPRHTSVPLSPSGTETGP